jgi:hypothetical protein
MIVAVKRLSDVAAREASKLTAEMVCSLVKCLFVFLFKKRGFVFIRRFL